MKVYRSATAIAVISLVLAASLSGCLRVPYIPPPAPPPGMSTWAYNMTEISLMNSLGFNGSGVIVALVDTGINLGHPAMANITISGWVDLVNGNTTPYDDEGHGTQMASIILWGAPEARFVAIKAVDSEGRSKDSRIADAVRFAIDPNGDGDRRDGADVISLSLGGGRLPILGTETEKAVKDAISRGIFVVAAADNDGEMDNGDVASPASVKMAISVGAVDGDGKIAAFSSKGANDGSLIPPLLPRKDPDRKPELVAPGVSIYCPKGDAEYDFGSGTSHATAFVSCCISLLLGALPDNQQERNGGETTIVKFKQVLKDTALKLDGQANPHDDHYGYGLVQVHRAYTLLSG